MARSINRRQTRPTGPRLGTGRPAAEIVLLAALGLIPVLFYRGTIEASELPKTSLLATAMLVVAAIALSREFARFRSIGPGAWGGSLGGRILAGLDADPLGGAVLLFLASAAASTAASIRPELSLWGAADSNAGLKTALATAAVYFAARSVAAHPGFIHRVAVVASAAAGVAMAYAILQLVGLDPFEWTWTATFNDFRRVPGTLGHANHLGTYLAMTLPLTFFLASRSRSRTARIAWSGMALVGLLVLAVTLSRGAWVAFVAAALTYAALFALSRSGAGARQPERAPAGKRFARIAAAGLLAIAMFFAPLLTPMRSSLITRLHQIADVKAPSTQSRIHLWRAGIQMAGDHPALGVGTDAYIAAFPHYRSQEYWRVEWNGISAKAHNELIQIAATQGALGLVAALLVVVFTARAVLRVAGHRSDEVRAAAAAAGAALTALAVSDLAGFTVIATGSLAAALAGWAAGQARPLGSMPEGAEVSGVALPLRVVAGAVALAVWIPLVVVPWRAAVTATRGLRLPITSPARAEALERACDIAPWDAHYASDLGRTLLTQAFSSPDPERSWRDLARARATYERVVRIAPESAEDRALLARVLAAQAARRPGSVSLDQVRAEFQRVLSADSTSANVLELATQGYLEVELYREARAPAIRCATLYTDFALPMADLGVIALAEDRYADAADTLELALRRNWHGEMNAEAAARRNLETARIYAAEARASADAEAVNARKPRLRRRRHRGAGGAS